jgi:hypothetical protein
MQIFSIPIIASQKKKKKNDFKGFVLNAKSNKNKKKICIFIVCAFLNK